MAGSGIDGITPEDRARMAAENRRVDFSGGFNGDPVSGYNIHGDDGLELNLQNPAMIDLAQANPELYSEILRLRQQRGSMNLEQYYDPNRLWQREQEAVQQAQTNLSNQFSRYGMSGSSAEMGALAESGRQIGFGFEDRRLADMQRAAQMELAYSGAIQGGIGNIQNQYGQFQGGMVNTVMGLESLEAQKAAADAQLWSGIAGGVATLGAFALAGPAGGLATGAATKGVSGAAMEYGIPGNSSGWTPDYSSPSSMGQIGAPSAMSGYNSYMPGYFT